MKHLREGQKFFSEERDDDEKDEFVPSEPAELVRVDSFLRGVLADGFAPRIPDRELEVLQNEAGVGGLRLYSYLNSQKGSTLLQCPSRMA